MTGALEPTNDAYAIAEIAGIMQVQSIRRQYGLPYISAMPTNLYGSGDNFDLDKSHVTPAKIRGSTQRSCPGKPDVSLWAPGRRGGSSCTSTTSRGRACSSWRTATTRRPQRRHRVRRHGGVDDQACRARPPR